MEAVITKVRKFLVARSELELAALVESHRAKAWQRVGEPIVAASGLLEFGRYQQVIEKEMPERVFVSLSKQVGY